MGRGSSGTTRVMASPVVSATASDDVPSLKQMMESQNHQLGLLDSLVYDLERECGTSRPEVASPTNTPQTVVEQTLVNGARLHEIWERLSAVRNAVGG